MTVSRTLLAVGVLLTGFNLRIGVASVPPVIDEIERDLGLSSAAAGMLTAAPVLCFGLAAPFAPMLARRMGAEPVLLLALVPIAAGTLVRWVPDAFFLFAGTLVMGIGVAIGNVIVPGVIKGRFGDRVGALTGAYAMAMGTGAAAAAGLTVPFGRLLDLDWEVALAAWALPAGCAAAVLVVALRADRGPRTVRGGVGDVRGLLRDPLAWWVSLHMGVQSFIFYAGLAWLPALLTSAGYSSVAAGGLLSVYALAGMPASLLMGVLAGRTGDQRMLAVAVAGCEAVAIVGLLVAPAGAPVWVALFGIGQGASISLSLALIVLRAPTARRAAELSGVAHTVGYSLAATGPLIGGLHDLTGSWDLPFVVMLACTVPMAALGLRAGRPGAVRL